MALSIRNLLSYAWAKLVAALGTTTLSILLFSFAIPLIIFSVTVAIGWREQRRAGKTVKDIIKGSILSWPTIIPSTIYLLAWVALLGWSLSNTAYKDHVALLGRIRTLASQNKTFKAENEGLRDENKQLKAMAPKTITRTLPAAEQSPEVRIFPVSHDLRPGIPKMEYVMTTGKIRTPVEIVATCDFPISAGASKIMTVTGGSAETIDSQRVSTNQFKLLTYSPAWSPMSPMWVTIFFDGKVDRMPSCRFTVP